ncbi:MAG: carboxymuconolactone decarboxylase family protein [Pseudomonadota bacterium]
MNERLGPIAADQMSQAQRAAAQAVIDGPRGALYGPFVPLLRSPELMEHAQRMGEYLRYRSALGPRLSELAILITARHWDQAVEWAIHAPIATASGVKAELVASIGRRARPSGMAFDESAVYDFCSELHQQRKVGEASYAAALALLGEQGVLDLTGICGYYSLLAMVMNVAHTAVPASAAAALPDC